MEWKDFNTNQNFFSFYGFLPCLRISESELKQVYLQRAKEFHPDHNSQNISDIDYISLSAFNNLAYKTLSKFNLRLDYLLTLFQFEKQSISLSKDFLMEMMFMNEEISESTPEKTSSLLEKLKKYREINALTIESYLQMEKIQLNDLNSFQDLSIYSQKENYFSRIEKLIQGKVEI